MPMFVRHCGCPWTGRMILYEKDADDFSWEEGFFCEEAELCGMSVAKGLSGGAEERR